MALACGADAVFALPVSFACAAADRFALGGITLLNALGVVTHQAFGCESAGDSEALRRAAACLNEEPPAFRETLRSGLDAGLPYPQAQAEALEAARGVPAGMLGAPNNILAVAYLRALERTASAVRPVFIQRQGSRSTGSGGTGSPLPSSAIRELILRGEPDLALAEVPASSAAIIRECVSAGRLCHPEALTQALFYRLYTASPDELAACAPHGEGLENRLVKALSGHPTSTEELLDRLKTRRYTRAALRRWLNQLLLGFRPGSQPDTPDHLRLLGFRESARPLLSEIRKRAALPLVTKPARGKAYLADDARAELLWSLGAGQAASLYEQSPIILSE